MTALRPDGENKVSRWKTTTPIGGVLGKSSTCQYGPAGRQRELWDRALVSGRGTHQRHTVGTVCLLFPDAVFPAGGRWEGDEREKRGLKE